MQIESNKKNTPDPKNIPPNQQPVPLGTKQWEDLRQAQPSEICKRSLAAWDDQGYYTLTFLETPFRLYPATETVDTVLGDPLTANPEFRLVLLCYLLGAQNIAPTAHWVSEKDLKGGSMFFVGPHSLPAEPLVNLFGNDPQRFATIGKNLGGHDLTGYGDVAIVFPVLPRIPCACVLWAADEEFPARVTYLFDASIEAHLALDVINALVRYLVKIIVKASSR